MTETNDERSAGMTGRPDDHELRHQDEDGGTLNATRNHDASAPDPDAQLSPAASVRPQPRDETDPTGHKEPDELGRLDPKLDPMSNDNR